MSEISGSKSASRALPEKAEDNEISPLGKWNEWNEWMEWDEPRIEGSQADETDDSWKGRTSVDSQHEGKDGSDGNVHVHQPSPLNMPMSPDIYASIPGQPFLGGGLATTDVVGEPISPALFLQPEQSLHQAEAGERETGVSRAPASARGKRKSTEEQRREEPTSPLPRRNAHNAVEKRYRVNLNGKIAALRDSVPSLRLRSRLAPSLRNHTTTEDVDEGAGEGNASANNTSQFQSLNKSTILVGATDYIKQLERKVLQLEGDNSKLKERLARSERKAKSAGSSAEDSSDSESARRHGEDVASSVEPTSSTSGKDPPQGMIVVPEEVRRLFAGQPQQHYAYHWRGSKKKENDEQEGTDDVKVFGSFPGLV